MHASIINAPHLHHPLNAEGPCHPEDQLPLPSVRNHEHQHWTLRNSSGVGKGIDKSVVQSGRDFPYIRVGGGQ